MLSIKLFALCTLLTVVLAVPTLKRLEKPADDCDKDKCLISANCRCSSASSPIPADQLNVYPQLISITFTDAVSKKLSDLIERLIGNRVNPDENPMLATLFVPHEFTNYQIVNDLYNQQYEIGVHSITRNNLQEYWRNASAKVLEQEFGGQRTIIAKFANIPVNEVIGARTPQYQLNGNDSIRAYIRSSLMYDNTWPTNPMKPLFPYTLDYKSTQECVLGTNCPNEPFAGFWMLPINDLVGESGDCNNLGACNKNGTAEEISNWLIDEVDRIRNSTKVPITLSADINYFTSTKNSELGFNMFLGAMQERKDVFFVTQSQILSWMKNPVDKYKFKTKYDPDKKFASCLRRTCHYHHPENIDLTVDMNACTRCPPNYPWLGNPYGI